MLIGLSAALCAAVLFGVGSIVQARAVRKVPISRLTLGLVGTLIREPLFQAAIALNLLGFGLHLIALRHVPLFLAQCGIALSLAVTALLAVLIFKDRLKVSDWLAVAAVCTGVALLASSAGSVGTDDPSTTFLICLGAAVALLAVVGFLASRRQGTAGVEILGLLAGFGFAGVGISARVVPSLAPLDILTAPAAYILVVSGALAYTLYSLALQRGSVTGATAPMIVSQTVTPAVVGVVFLGDNIRDGWLPVAIVAFVITAVGAVALARFEGSSTHIHSPESNVERA